LQLLESNTAVISHGPDLSTKAVLDSAVDAPAAY
jgi:hypothetical protein